MLQLVYILGSIIFLANSGQCELTWDTVYNLLSSRLDNIVFDVKSKENSMSRQISDLMETVTATNQQLATFEQRLSDVAKCSQQLSIFEKKLDDMDSHVIGIATAEIGRRMSVFRRGLEQEKATSQSRFDFVRMMQETAQSDINFVMTAANEMQVRISDAAQDIKSAFNETAKLLLQTGAIKKTQDEVLQRVDDIDIKLNETRVRTFKLEHDMSVTVYNITYLLAQISTLEKTQLEIKGATDKTSAQIGTVEQKVSSKQSNFDKLQSRVFAIEDTQRDLKSKTRTIETQVDTTLGQISRLQSITRTFAGFYARLIKKSDHYTKGTVITFDDVVYNDGSHYNPSTGIFTVPVSGVYVFMFNVEVKFDSRETNRSAHVELKVNGNMRASAYVSGIAGLSGGNAAVLKVTAGDKISVSTARYKKRYYISMYRTSFSGALVYVS